MCNVDSKGAVQISIEKIQRRDIIDVIELLQEISEFKPQMRQMDEIWEIFRSQKNVHGIVAKIDSQIVGYGCILIESKIRGGKLGHIEDIVSHPAFRKLGVGKEIVDHLCKIGQHLNCYKISLQCNKDNLEFYRKCGFDRESHAMNRLFVEPML